MTAFTRHRGKAVLLDLDNVDTDLIIPMQPLLERPRSELGSWAFKAIRYDDQGHNLPEFPFNMPGAEDASIIVAGRNFGCGSSREGAVYALEAMGVRAVLAFSFGDIFYGNAVKNGLLPVRLNESHLGRVARVLAGRPAADRMLDIDLVCRSVTLPDGEVFTFDIEPSLVAQMLAGRDEVDATLMLEKEIRAFQANEAVAHSWRLPSHPPVIANR